MTMTQPGSSYFAEYLSDFTATQFRCFVADLWSMRGRTITIDGNLITLTHPQTKDIQYLHIIHADESLKNSTLEKDCPVDLIVTNVDRKPLQLVAQNHEARYIGPVHLREMLSYAIDRKDSKLLLKRYFDRPFSLIGYQQLIGSEDSQNQTNQSKTNDSIKDDGPEDVISIDTGWELNWDTIAMVCLAFTVAGLTLIGLTAIPQASPSPIDHRPTQQTVDLSGSSLAHYPSGINSTGITNVTKLTKTHTERIQNHSYELTISHSDSRGVILTRLRWIRSHHTIQVYRSASYWYKVNGTISPATIGGKSQRVNFIEYKDHTTCRQFALTENRFRQCTDNSSIRFTNAITQLLHRYLDTSESRVTILEDEHRYRVVATGEPNQITGGIGIRNYRAIAIIDRSGIVRWFHVEYRSQLGGNQNLDRIHASFQYKDIGTETAPNRTKVKHHLPFSRNPNSFK